MRQLPNKALSCYFTHTHHLVNMQSDLHHGTVVWLTSRSLMHVTCCTDRVSYDSMQSCPYLWGNKGIYIKSSATTEYFPTGASLLVHRVTVFKTSSHTTTDNRREREGPIISQLSCVYLANLMNWNVVIQEVVAVLHDTVTVSFLLCKKVKWIMTLLCESHNWQ